MGCVRRWATACSATMARRPILRRRVGGFRRRRRLGRIRSPVETTIFRPAPVWNGGEGGGAVDTTAAANGGTGAAWNGGAGTGWNDDPPAGGARRRGGRGTCTPCVGDRWRTGDTNDGGRQRNRRGDGWRSSLGGRSMGQRQRSTFVDRRPGGRRRRGRSNRQRRGRRQHGMAGRWA